MSAANVMFVECIIVCWSLNKVFYEITDDILQDAGFEVLYPLSYLVPVRERYGSTLLPATREQHDQNCTQSH